MADLQEIMGRVIRRERQDRHLTIKELGDKAGLSEIYVGEIERGQKYPSAKVLESIAKALDLDIADLLELMAEETETPTGATSVGATPGVARVVGTNAMIGKSTPDEHQNSSYQNGANQRYAIERWLADDAKMEDADDQQNCQKAKNDRAEQTI